MPACHEQHNFIVTDRCIFDGVVWFTLHVHVILDTMKEVFMPSLYILMCCSPPFCSINLGLLSISLKFKTSGGTPFLTHLNCFDLFSHGKQHGTFCLHNKNIWNFKTQCLQSCMYCKGLGHAVLLVVTACSTDNFVH